MTSELITIENVRGYLTEDGTAFLNAEDVAKGWGFVEVKDGKEYVRWRTVNGYLKEFGISQQVAKEDFIPENIVYRLGFKANNQTAQEFQALLADEVLPALRKTGSYTIKKPENKPENKMQVMADELTATLNMSKVMQEFFGMDESMSKIFALRTGLNGKYKVIDEKTVDVFIKQLPASIKNDVEELTPTDIADKLSKELKREISNQKLNKDLEKLGYQVRINKIWTLTDKAKDYAKKVPYQNDYSGHCGFQVKWNSKIIDVLLDYYKNN